MGLQHTFFDHYIPVPVPILPATSPSPGTTKASSSKPAPLLTTLPHIAYYTSLCLPVPGFCASACHRTARLTKPDHLCNNYSVINQWPASLPTFILPVRTFFNYGSRYPLSLIALPHLEHGTVHPGPSSMPSDTCHSLPPCLLSCSIPPAPPTHGCVPT